jgi:diacylglycerol kinase family enzyme
MTAAAVPVILNAHSGVSQQTPPANHIRDLLRAAGIPGEVVAADDGKDLAGIAQAAVARKPPMIIAAGGDGTISAVAAYVAGTGIPLGVLPLGTLNHFARDLGIPSDIDGAIRVLAARSITRVDVGEVNGHLFVNNSSIGLYPRLVTHRQRQQHRLGRGNWTALLRAALTVLHRYPVFSVQVRADDVELKRRTPVVFVGNNAYEMDGLDIGHRMRLDGGALCLYIPRRPGRWGLMSTVIRSLFGFRSPDDFDRLTAQEIRIDTRHRSAHVAIDGEVLSLPTPLRYKIRPLALSVIAPRGGSTEDSTS